MKHLKNRAILLLLLSFVCINVNAWYINYVYINDNTEVKVVGIVLEAIKHDFGYIIREERIDEVKTVEIPSFYNGLPVTIIGDEAFKGCYNLVSVTLPSNLKKIGERAFDGCHSLPSVTIPNSVTSIGLNAFQSCSGLTSVTIPNSVTSIGAQAFMGCSGLTSVTIPNSVTSIGAGAFQNCSGLTSVTIPNSVTSIPNGVTSIGPNAFSDCTSLTSVTIGNSVGKIEYCAFWGCPLESIIFGSGHYKVGTYAFGRSNDCNVHIPDLSYWLQIAFDNIDANPLYGLKNKLFVNGEEILSGSLVIENINIVKPYTLAGQDKITSVFFSSDVESIGGASFLDCKNLTSITLSNGVRTIGREAFRGTKLRSVTIPASIEYIGADALGKSRLDYVVILKDTPPSVESSVESEYLEPFYTSVLYVPLGSYEKYKRTRPWSYYNIIEGVPSGIESVEEGHAEELGRYLLDGTKVEEPQKGLNIIRYSDGSTKQVIVK